MADTPPLSTRRLGRTSLMLSELGFGGAPIGGFYRHCGEDESVAAIRRAHELGIRYFDTAPLYGYGRSELLMGHALRSLPPDETVLSTKVGRYLVPLRDGESSAGLREGGLPMRPVLDYGYDGAMRSLEQSLLRLGGIRPRLVLVHDLDAHAQGSDEAAARALDAALAGAFRALAELRRSGEIGAFGIGVNEAYWATRIASQVDLDAIMIAGRYTLLQREAATELLPVCVARSIAVLAAAPFNGGLLAAPPGEIESFNYRAVPPRIVERHRKIVRICAAYNVPVHAATLQFALRHPAVASVVVGARTAAEIESAVSALTTLVPEGCWAQLEDVATC